MGRSSKVQRAFSKAREAEAKRQHEIKIAESEVSKISQARSTLSLLSNPRSRMDNTNEKYRLDRMYNSRNNTMKWGNTRGNRIDWIPVSQLQGIANQNLESAKQRVATLKAQPSRAISMQQANQMTGSSRTQQRGASLSTAKASGVSMASVTGSGLVQKAYADTASQQAKTIKPNISSADATNPANFFRTGSGSVTVSQDGNVISPQSEQGRELQAIYDRQQAQKNVNVEQKKLFDRVTGAKDYKEAFSIQEKSSKINPNVGTFQATLKGGEVREVRGTDPRNITGRTTVVQTNSLGDPMALQAQKDFFGMDGKRVATIFGESAGSSPTYRTPPRQTNQRIAQGGLPTQQSTVATGFFDSLIKGASTPTSEGRSFQQQNYLQDSEKAFSFFPDLAKGDDVGSQIQRGVTKGASNTLASFWNLGLMAGEGIEKATGYQRKNPIEYVPYYSTPITNVETGAFDSAVGVGSQFFGGVPVDTKQAGEKLGTGFREAGENFYNRPVEAFFSSSVEAVPYAVGSVAKGIKGGVKIGYNVIDDFFNPKPKGSFSRVDMSNVSGSRQWVNKIKAEEIADAKKRYNLLQRQPPTPKNTQEIIQLQAFLRKNKGAGQSQPRPRVGEDFFASAKQKPKPKPSTTKPPKVKPSDIVKSSAKKNPVNNFFNLKPKKSTPKGGVPVKARPDGFLVPKGGTGGRFGLPSFWINPKLPVRNPRPPDPPVKDPDGGTGGRGRPWGLGGFWSPYAFGGGGGGGRSGNRMGSRAFKLWDVNPNKVGGFFDFGDAGYKASRSPFIFFEDSKRVSKGGSNLGDSFIKFGKNTKDPIKDFFG
jgi:hypothetical protein